MSNKQSKGYKSIAKDNSNLQPSNLVVEYSKLSLLYTNHINEHMCTQNITQNCSLTMYTVWQKKLQNMSGTTYHLIS